MIKSWQLMIRLKIKNYSTTITEKLQNYHPFHQPKLINMNIKLLLSKEWEISKNILNESADKIEELTKKNHYDLILLLKLVVQKLLLVKKKILLPFLMILKQMKKQ